MEIKVKDRNGQEFTYKNSTNRPLSHIVIATYPGDAGTEAVRKIVSGSTSFATALKAALRDNGEYGAHDIDIVELAAAKIQTVTVTVAEAA
jgi:hypothetical protein